MSETFDVPESSCPACGHKMGHCTPAFKDHDAPKPGDLGVCIRCGAINQYDKKLILCAVEDTDGDSYEDARKAQAAVLAMRRLH